MKIYDDEIASDVRIYLEEREAEFGRDEIGIHLVYPCGCRWTREARGKKFVGVVYLCFRHEVIELAAREGMKDEARRRSAADRDGASSP
jgi:hypothetical protein